MTPQELEQEMRSQAETVANAAANPMLRDMLHLSRGELRDNLMEAYMWGYRAGFSRGAEIMRAQSVEAIQVYYSDQPCNDECLVRTVVSDASHDIRDLPIPEIGGT